MEATRAQISTFSKCSLDGDLLIVSVQMKNTRVYDNVHPLS